MNKLQEPLYEIVQEQEPEESNELARMLGVLIDDWQLIVAVTVVFVIGGFLGAIFTTPVYKADALLQIERKSTGMQGLSDITGSFAVESESITEIEVLKSRMVMGRVVEELNLDIVAQPKYMGQVGEGLSRMLSKGMRDTFAAVFSSYAWGGEKIHVARLEVPENLLGRKLVLVAGDSGTYQLFGDGELLVKGKVGELAEGSGIRILVTDMTNRAGLEFLIQHKSKLAAIRTLQRMLSVTEKGARSGVLTISLEGTDRQKTKRILDSVSRQYLMQNVQRLSAEAEKSLAFLEKQLPEFREKLAAAEAILNSFRLKNESVDLSLETQSILGQVVTLDSQINELALEEQKLKKSFTREHPYYIALLEKRDALMARKEQLQSKIKNLPETQQEILRLTRDVEVNQEIYVEMLNKTQELSIAKAGTVGNVRILDTAALLDYPVKPRKGLIVILALIFGAILGVIIAFTREAFRHGIKSPDQLESIGLPVYATVPMSAVQQNMTKEQKRKIDKGEKPDSIILAKTAPDDIAIESMRSLRTSMHFAMLETQKNILMITGPGQELGKSFVSANLGAVYAISNQKVLIVDADMRKGHMHRAFGTEKENGLSELLSEQIDKQVAIKHTEIEGLDFIPCGITPPNPSELLMHKNLQDFLEWASKQYDLVIIDTPPVLAVTDATVVGRYAGVTMFVARFEETRKKEVETALRRCEQSGINVKGCILNGIIHRSSSSYGYGYGGYRYYRDKYAEEKA